MNGREWKKMISTTRIVPIRLHGPRRAGLHRGRRRGVKLHRRPPIDGRYEISEIFSIDDDEFTDTDILIDHVLRRGSIKGRPL